MNQADLIEKTGIRKNTISRATRGLPTTTNTLAEIAKAFQEPLELVLVSPEWIDKQDTQRRVIQDAVERALRSVSDSPTLPVDRAEHATTIATLADTFANEMERVEHKAHKRKSQPRSKTRQGRRKK